MRKYLFIIAATLVATPFVSCKDPDKDKGASEQVKEAYIDATSNTLWHYYSFAQTKIVGSAEESEENNAEWGARKDWDIAVKRYSIRTNSGEFTSVDAKGGVYTCASDISFESVTNAPSENLFALDKAITSTDMSGTTIVVRSEATVILFKQNEDGSLVMPPIYLSAPVYVFRTADGNSFYKVKFTQYKNENDISGHVKFNIVKITK